MTRSERIDACVRPLWRALGPISQERFDLCGCIGCDVMRSHFKGAVIGEWYRRGYYRPLPNPDYWLALRDVRLAKRGG